MKYEGFFLKTRKFFGIGMCGKIYLMPRSIVELESNAVVVGHVLFFG